MAKFHHKKRIPSNEMQYGSIWKSFKSKENTIFIHSPDWWSVKCTLNDNKTTCMTIFIFTKIKYNDDLRILILLVENSVKAKLRLSVLAYFSLKVPMNIVNLWCISCFEKLSRIVSKHLHLKNCQSLLQIFKSLLSSSFFICCPSQINSNFT